MKRNNSLSTLFLAFWIGGLIGLLIRRHRERQLGEHARRPDVSPVIDLHAPGHRPRSAQAYGCK